MTLAFYRKKFKQLYILIFAIIISTFLNLPLFAEDGPQLFKDYCESCHGNKARGPDRVAPPIVAVKSHYLNEHQNEEKFVSAIVGWLEKPEHNKTLMPGAIRRFGVMPPLELEPNERQVLAKYIFETEFKMPGWYREHFRKEHGKDPQ